MPCALIFQSYWRPYLDQTAPQVSIVNSAERISIGKNGGSFRISVSDEHPGLDEVIVRIRQLREDHQLLKKKLKGERAAELQIEIPAIQPDAHGHHMLSEGAGELEVVAFDRSFYSNRGVAETKAFIDLKMPRIEPLSTQHNLRQGGSQLVFYFASDENLKFSGIRAGKNIFRGFRAAQLDPAFARKGLYAALYTVPPGSDLKTSDLELIAEDAGGNQAKAGFYNKIAKRSYRKIRTSNARLVEWLNSFDYTAEDDVDPEEQYVEREAKGDIDAAGFSKGFEKVEGTVLVAFGDRFEQGVKEEQNLGDGFVFTGLSRAKALQSGEVLDVLKYSNGLYAVRIQHALGLSTSYIGLTSALVDKGQQVRTGQELGTVADYMKICAYLGSQAVDPTEWWARDWLAAHLLDKMAQTKRALGIIEE